MNVIAAIGLYADWIIAGKISSKNGRVYFDLDNNELVCSKLTDKTNSSVTIGGVSYANVVAMLQSVLTGDTQTYGLHLYKEGFENYLSCMEPFSQRACLTPSAGPSRHGTADLFASILMADALNGVDFSVSVQKAADFISKCISASKALQIPEPDGVCFENFLSDLADQ